MGHEAIIDEIGIPRVNFSASFGRYKITRPRAISVPARRERAPRDDHTAYGCSADQRATDQRDEDAAPPVPAWRQRQRHQDRGHHRITNDDRIAEVETDERRHSRGDS